MIVNLALKARLRVSRFCSDNASCEINYDNTGIPRFSVYLRVNRKSAEGIPIIQRPDVTSQRNYKLLDGFGFG